MLPSIGVVIATPGRASIYRTLRSIAYQGLIPGDDVLVVGDGLHQATKNLVEAFGPPFRYIATRMTRDWGHSQLTWGFKRVGGSILTYQDDDDIYLPRAFEEMRRLMAEHPDQPLIGRVKTPNWGLLWREPGVKTLLDGHCLVSPNDKKKLGYMPPEYYGDQCYISTTIEHYPSVNWVDRVWTLTRPAWKLFPSRVQVLSKDIYSENFVRELAERLPSVAGREIASDDDWMWLFYDQNLGVDRPVAALRMFEEESRAWATMSFVPGTEQYIEEVVEFAAWAGQGRDVWFGTLSDDEEIITELRKKGFQDHMTGPPRADFVLSWPPKWFPSQNAVEITDEQGVHVPDWRDKFTP